MRCITGEEAAYMVLVTMCNPSALDTVGAKTGSQVPSSNVQTSHPQIFALQYHIKKIGEERPD